MQRVITCYVLWIYVVEVRKDTFFKKTHHFQRTFRIEVTRSEEDQQKIVVIAIVQIRGVVQQSPKIFDGRSSRLRSFTQLSAGNFEQLRRRRRRVNIEWFETHGTFWIRTTQNFNKNRNLDAFGTN